MCHYITGILPARADVAVVNRLAKCHGRGWELMERHSLQRHLHDGETYYLTTRAHCDCGTGWGALTAQQRRQSGEARKVVRLRSKGWSENRIARWQEEKQKHTAQHTIDPENPPGDVVEWCAFLRGVLTSGASCSIGLLLHMYSGLIETEPIAITDRRWIPIDDLGHEVLLRAEEDVIYMFGVPDG